MSIFLKRLSGVSFKNCLAEFLKIFFIPAFINIRRFKYGYFFAK